MKNEYIVTVEVRKLIKIPIEASDEVEAEALAEYELECTYDEETPCHVEWFVYNVEEANV
jgi:hypothetical protein